MTWLDPHHLIAIFGLLGILAIVFAESGLLVGFFLPGDSLLFTAGLLVARHSYLTQPLWLVCVLVVLAAVAGDQAGYLFGRRVGAVLSRRPDSRLFKQKNIDRAHSFFERYGPRSIVLARFVPVVRTFTPIVAGASRMTYRIFLVYNLIGGTLWGAGVLLLGFFLGQSAMVNAHIDLILVGIVALSLLPIAVELMRARRAEQRRSTGANHNVRPETHSTPLNLARIEGSDLD